MPTILGKLDFTRTQIETKLGPEVRVADYDCSPPPAGTQTNYNPPTQANLAMDQRFLQARETSAMLAGATVAGSPAATLDSIAAHLAQALGFQPLTIDLNNIPAAWKQVVHCFNTSVRYQVEYIVWEINAKATEAVTLDGQAFPVGDTVASFRVEQPDRYRFLRRFTYNKQCCPLGPNVPEPPPFSETGDWFPIRFQIKLNLDGWNLKPESPWHWNPYPYAPIPEGGGGSGGGSGSSGGHDH